MEEGRGVVRCVCTYVHSHALCILGNGTNTYMWDPVCMHQYICVYAFCARMNVCMFVLYMHTLCV